MILHINPYLEEFELGSFSLQDSDSDSSIPSPQYVPISGGISGIGLGMNSRGRESGSDNRVSRVRRSARSRASVGRGTSPNGEGSVDEFEDGASRRGGRGGGRVGWRGGRMDRRGGRQITRGGRGTGDNQVRGRRGDTRSRTRVVRGGETGRNGGNLRSRDNENVRGQVRARRWRFGSGWQVSGGHDGDDQNPGRPDIVPPPGMISIESRRTEPSRRMNAALAQVVLKICYYVYRAFI